MQVQTLESVHPLISKYRQASWLKNQRKNTYSGLKYYIKYDTGRSRVAWLLFFTRCDVSCDLLQYTRMGKCNLFVLYNKNSNGFLKDLGVMKKEEQVRWRGFGAICVCVL